MPHNIPLKEIQWKIHNKIDIQYLKMVKGSNYLSQGRSEKT